MVDDGPVTWIWMGNPALADKSLIVRQAWMNDARWPSSRERYHLGANYVALHENLLDLTHLSFLHAKSFGTPDYASAPFEVEIDRVRGRFVLTRNVSPTRLPPVWAQPTGLDGVDAARIARSEFLTPGLHVVNVRFYRADSAPDVQPDRQICTAHIVTPETSNSTHYFIYHARNFAQEESWVTSFMHENLSVAFQEDIRCLEDIEAMMARVNDRDFYEVTIGSDKPAVAMRRHLKRLADQEKLDLDPAISAAAHGEIAAQDTAIPPDRDQRTTP
jgi:vanillate O-demethylase monooxygenase subunit